MIFATLLGSVVFSVAFAFRNGPEAAVEAPVFVWVVTVFRFLSYAWLGCIIAPLGWALRHVAWYLATVLLFDVVLLGYSFGLMGAGDLLAGSAFGGWGLRVCALVALALLGYGLVSSLRGAFKAGVETTRLYGRPGTVV